MPDIDTKELRRLMDASEALFQEWLDRAEDDDHPARAAILDRFNSAHFEFLNALGPALPALLSEAEEAARLRKAFRIADQIACDAIRWGYFVEEALLDQLAEARALTTGGDDARD